MRTTLALILFSSPLLAADGVSRPRVEPPRFVVPPAPQPAPPAVEMDASLRRAPPAVAPVDVPAAVAPARSSALALEASARLRSQVRVACVDGRIWARGRDYKATFGPEGLLFVPYLGADAPRNFPVTFGLGSLHAEGEQIELEHVADAVEANGRVTIDRGIVDEIYVPGVDGVEQLFVLEERPGDGDCVLRVRVTSELEPVAGAETIRFANELGGVNYGRAFALAEDGARIPLETEFVDDHVEIRLPSELLAGARFPLVVDPMITTQWFPLSSSSAQSEVGIDVAFDASTGRGLFVLEEVYSATDHDALAVIVDSFGGSIAENYFDFTSDDWVGLKVATYADYDEFMTVASVRPFGTGTVRKIRGVLTRPLASIVWGTPFDVAAGTDALINPDVGGDPYPGSSYFCVVFERVLSATNHDIEYRTVDGFGNVFNVGAVLDNSTGTLDQFPRISKSNMTGDWQVVWSRQAPGGDHDVYGASITYWGGLAQAAHGVSIFAGFDDTFPVVTGLLHSGEHAVFVLTNYSSARHVEALQMLGTTPNGFFTVGQFPPYADQLRIDTDSRRLFVTYTEYFSATLAETRFTELQRINGTWSTHWSQNVNPTALSTPIYGTCVTSKYAGGSNSGDALFGYIQRDPSTMLGRGVASLFESAGYGTFFPTCAGDGSGTACPCGPNGGSSGGCQNSVTLFGAGIYATGDGSLVNDTLQLHGTGMPNGGVLYFQGTQNVAGGAGSVFGDGLLCIGGTITRLGVKINVGGASQFPEGTDPGLASLSGLTEPGTRYYQAWYRDSAAFCTPATFNLSSALPVIWFW